MHGRGENLSVSVPSFEANQGQNFLCSPYIHPNIWTQHFSAWSPALHTRALTAGLMHIWNYLLSKDFWCMQGVPDPFTGLSHPLTFWALLLGGTRSDTLEGRGVFELLPRLLCTLKWSWAKTSGQVQSKTPLRCSPKFHPGSHLYSSSKKWQILEEPELEKEKGRGGERNHQARKERGITTSLPDMHRTAKWKGIFESLATSSNLKGAAPPTSRKVLHEWWMERRVVQYSLYAGFDHWEIKYILASTWQLSGLSLCLTQSPPMPFVQRTAPFWRGKKEENLLFFG